MLKKSPKSHKFSRAFTIVELLVIIAVIVILIFLVTIQMQPSKAKARDSKRISEINALRTALQMHYMDHGKYPKSTPDEEWCSIEGETAEVPQCHVNSFYEKLKPYLLKMPGDPLFPNAENGKFYSYQYRSTSSGDGYMLHTDLEIGDPYELYSYIGKTIVYGNGNGNGNGGTGSYFFKTIKGESGYSGMIGRGRSALKTSDGGYVIIGDGRYFSQNNFADIFMIKLDSNTDLEWTKAFGISFSNITRGSYSITGHNGGYLMTGKIEAPGQDDEYWFAELDSDFDVVNSKMINDKSLSKTQTLQFFEKNSSGYLFSGITAGLGGSIKSDMFAVQLNSALDDISWAYTIDTCDDSYEYFGFAQETADGGVIMAGEIPAWCEGFGYSQVIIAKIDPSGGTLEWSWKIRPSTANTTNVRNILKDSNGNHFVLGTTNLNGTQLFLIKFDQSGNIDWIKGLGGGSYNRWGTVLMRELSDGYIIAAATGLGAGEGNILLMKLNSDITNIEWAKALGEDETDIVNFIGETAGGDFIITGYQDIGDPSPDEQEIVFALLNSDGDIPDCSYLSDQTSSFGINDLTSSFTKIDWAATTTLVDESATFELKNRNLQIKYYNASTTIRDICPE